MLGKPWVLAAVLVGCLAGCTSDSAVDGGGSIDSPRDAGTDATIDAPVDSGPDRGCPPGPIAPDVFDCNTADPGLTFGAPIVAPDSVWTYVPFDDALCMDGSSTGIVVNLNSASDRVFIFLQGGGACFDPISCVGAANPNGFDETSLPAYAGLLGAGMFNRADTNNPVADYNFVFIPYCTGDIHGGSNRTPVGGRVHLGYPNMSEYLERLVPTFSTASMVLLAGSSAGGIGTLVNYEQVSHAFGCTPVHVFDDAGPLLPDAYLRPCLQTIVRDTWNLAPAIPAMCPQCTCEDGGGLANVFEYLAARYPDRRFGHAIGIRDGTFRQFFGYGYAPSCNFPQQIPADDFLDGLLQVRAALDPYPNSQTYYIDTDRHTHAGVLSSTVSGGVALDDWLVALIEGDASTFVDVGP